MNWSPLILLAGEKPEQSSPLLPLLIPFVVIFLLYHLLIARPQRREQARREEMLKQLKKNDPVVTIGGIIGTVANISDDGTEVTLKVDDNTRLKFRRDAIREVISKSAPAPSKPTAG